MALSDLAKYSLTRSIARPLCDSRATCQVRVGNSGDLLRGSRADWQRSRTSTKLRNQIREAMLGVDFAADQLDDHHQYHRPRLCHVRSWNDGRGFGFNMQAERGKHGQYIGKVESGSPAEAAGLRDGDRIVEVNGSSIDHDTHKQVETTFSSALALFNPLECTGNYSATSNNMKLVHWPLMGGLLHLVQRGGDWAVDYY